MDREEMIKLFKEIEKEVNSPEYIKEHDLIEKQCDKIKLMALDTIENIQKAKEASRSIPDSAEKVLLFRYLIMIENELK